MFIGFHELLIDDKNRMSIPASFRASMDPREQVHFYLAPGEREHTLELFPQNYFEKYVSGVRESLGDSPEADDFELFFLSMSALLQVDSQGRVVLPQYQLQLAGIKREVVLLGRGDRLLLRNREDAHQFNAETLPNLRRLKQAAKKQTQRRRVMRRW